MHVHRNAKTTPKGRALLIGRVGTQRWSVWAAASASGVSVRTAYKWLARYRREGVAGLNDRSSRPVQSPQRVCAAVEAQIVALRRTRLSGPAIARKLGRAKSTVGDVLRRQGLSRLRALEPRPPVRRYEWARAGELVHVDTKALGRILRPGHRVTGDRRHQPRRVGWDHVHVCVDDATRLAYVEVLPSLHGVAAAAFLLRAVQWFGSQGVRVERVMTDNGSAYVSRPFQAACTQLTLRHLRTRPYTPRTNGKAERFIQTLLREWAYQRAYATSARRRRALRPWLRYYNHRRPHTALRDRAPITRLQEAAA